MQEVNYTLIRVRSNNMRLIINREGEVQVRAPLFISKLAADRFVISKRRWLEKQLEKIAAAKMVARAATRQALLKEKIIAKRLILERISHFNNDKRWRFGVVSVKDMRSRWGSCSSAGNLNFNYRLMYLPLELLDYVVVHELCHLEAHNHSSDFWSLVREVLPDYQERENKLKNFKL